MGLYIGLAVVALAAISVTAILYATLICGKRDDEIIRRLLGPRQGE